MTRRRLHRFFTHDWPVIAFALIVVMVLATFTVVVIVGLKAETTAARQASQCRREQDIRKFMLTARHARIIAAHDPHITRQERRADLKAARIYLRLASDFTCN